MIQDLSGSWCIKGTGESTLVMGSPVPLMHHDPDRSWITVPDPDHSKGTQPKLVSRRSLSIKRVLLLCQTERVKLKIVLLKLLHWRILYSLL